MFCKECGTQIPEGAIFCPKCGAAVKKMAGESQSNTTSSFNQSQQSSNQRKYQITVSSDVPCMVKRVENYDVKATDESEAEKQARELFMQKYPSASNFDFEYKKAKSNFSHIIAFVSFGIAICLSLIPWFDGRKSISIKPDLLSSVFSILLYSAIVIRTKGIKNSFEGIDRVYFILLVLVGASLMQTFLRATEFPILSKIPVIGDIVKKFTDGKFLIIIAIIFSWLGIKPVSLAIFILVAIGSIFKLFSISDVMGFWGGIYIICASLGFFLFLKNEDIVVAALSNKNWNAPLDEIKYDITDTSNAIIKKSRGD